MVDDGTAEEEKEAELAKVVALGGAGTKTEIEVNEAGWLVGVAYEVTSALEVESMGLGAWAWLLGVLVTWREEVEVVP